MIAGTGPFRQTLEALVGTLGLSAHVQFAGRVSDADLHAWYEAATVFVHPTRYEGSSLVTLEAMAHRRPVIATRAGGLPDKVQPGITGWLVDVEDVQGLALAITDAATDARRLVTFGQAGRRLVETDFSWPVLADRLLDVYRRTISG